MTFFKPLTAVAATLMLALAAGAVQAEPVALSFGDNQIKASNRGAKVVADVFDFTLDAPTFLSGLLQTASADSTPMVNITSAYLQLKSGGPQIWLTETVAGDWDNDVFSAETWTLSPQLLSAGDWQLHVMGEGFNTKLKESYQVNLEGAAEQLPEPAGLALVAIGLTALTVTRRRAARSDR